MALRFVCNICGSAESFSSRFIADPEEASCQACGSNIRLRWLVHRLSLELFGKSLTLSEFPFDRSKVGLGLTDPPSMADVLSQRLQYRNTYFDAEPRFDIRTDASPLGALDFLIASEVFEHVTPPVAVAFQNAARLLKPSGLFLLTTPWVWGGCTREHFPELHHWVLEQGERQWILQNRRADGTIEIFRDLVFHGGPGQTLEMRLFSRSGIERDLRTAGFASIEFDAQCVRRFGIVFPYPWGRPVAARLARRGVF